MGSTPPFLPPEIVATCLSLHYHSLKQSVCKELCQVVVLSVPNLDQPESRWLERRKGMWLRTFFPVHYHVSVLLEWGWWLGGEARFCEAASKCHYSQSRNYPEYPNAIHYHNRLVPMP